MVQHALVVDASGDFAEGIEGRAEIAGEKFHRAGGIEVGGGIGEAAAGEGEGIGVPGIDGDKVTALVEAECFGTGYNRLNERRNAFAGESGEGKGWKAEN